jgi:hypothetical protein
VRTRSQIFQASLGGGDFASCFFEGLKAAVALFLPIVYRTSPNESPVLASNYLGSPYAHPRDGSLTLDKF